MIAVSTLVGIAIDFAGINPISAALLDSRDQRRRRPAAARGRDAVANNKKVMGKRTNGLFTNIVGWLAAAVMFAAAIGMFLTWGQ